MQSPLDSPEPLAKSRSSQALILASTWRTLGWILLAGLLVRVGLWAWFLGEPLSVHDERDYNTLAVHLVQQGKYSLDGEHLTSIRPPLYPLFLAGVYRVAGLENYSVVRAVQAVVSLATVWLVFLLGSGLYDRRVGLWAAGLVCFYPSLLGQNNLLLTETWFTFWAVAACLAGLRFFETRGLWWLAAAGVLLGLGALTRTVLWLFPPVFALGIIVFLSERFPRRLAAAGVLLAAFAAVLAPWAIRNTRLHQTFVPIDVMGGRNLMMGNYEHTPLHRAWDAISIEGDSAWYRVLERECPNYKKLTQGQKDKLAMRRGLRFMAENPGLTLKRSVIKFFNFWQLERSFVAGMAQGHFGNPPTWALLLLTALIFGSYAVVFCLGVFGVLTRPPTVLGSYWMIVALVAYTCGLHSLVFAHSRYHLPLIPLVAIFAAAAISAAGQIWNDRWSLRFWVAGATCVVFAGSWAYEVIVIDMGRFLRAIS